MSMILKFDLEGRPELARTLDELIMIGDPEVVRSIMFEGAELIANNWRSKVPEPGPQHPYSTGEYRESIRVEPADDEGEFGIGLSILTDAVNEEDGFNYPEALEFGTETMSAFPSATPAFDESEEAAVTLAVERLNAEVLRRIPR